MSFFGGLPPSGERFEEYRGLPKWVLPPYDEIGAFVGMRRALLRTPESGVVLTDVVAYSCGFKLSVDVVRREGDMIEAMATTFDVRVGRVGEAKLLRMAIEFSDGRRATNLDRALPESVPEPEPGEVRVFELGGGGNDIRRSVEWWVTPLPPPGLVGIVIEWATASQEPVRSEIDADAIIEAARSSQRLWERRRARREAPPRPRRPRGWALPVTAAAGVLTTVPPPVSAEPPLPLGTASQKAAGRPEQPRGLAQGQGRCSRSERRLGHAEPCPERPSCLAPPCARPRREVRRWPSGRCSRERSPRPCSLGR